MIDYDGNGFISNEELNDLDNVVCTNLNHSENIRRTYFYFYTFIQFKTLEHINILFDEMYSMFESAYQQQSSAHHQNDEL